MKLIHLDSKQPIQPDEIFKDDDGNPWVFQGGARPIEDNGGRIWFKNAQQGFGVAIPSEVNCVWVEDDAPPSVTENRLEFLDNLYESEVPMSHEDYIQYFKSQFYVGDAEAREVFEYWMSKHNAAMKALLPKALERI